MPPLYLHHWCSKYPACQYLNAPQGKSGDYQCYGFGADGRACRGTYSVSRGEADQFINLEKNRLRRLDQGREAEGDVRLSDVRLHAKGISSSKRCGTYSKALPPIPTPEDPSHTNTSKSSVETHRRSQPRTQRRRNSRYESYLKQGTASLPSLPTSRPPAESKPRPHLRHPSQSSGDVTTSAYALVIDPRFRQLLAPGDVSWYQVPRSSSAAPVARSGTSRRDTPMINPLGGSGLKESKSWYRPVDKLVHSAAAVGESWYRPAPGRPSKTRC
mgnify:CR=1 FL=1